MSFGEFQVLLIENEHDIVRIIKKYLSESKKENYKIIVAKDLKNGIKILKQRHFDLLIMEISLLAEIKMDKIIELNNNFANIPILLLSNSEDQLGSIRYKIKGVQELLIKSQINKYILQKSVQYAFDRSLFQKVLQKQENYYSMMMEQSISGVYITDRAGRFIAANKLGLDFFGYSLSELKTMKLSDVVHPDDLHQATLEYKQIIQGYNVRSNKSFIRKDKQITHLEISGNLLADGNIVGIVQNVTFQKESEKKLIESEEKYRLIINSIVEGIILIDRNGIIIDYNKSCERLFGYTKNNVVGKNITVLMPDSYKNQHIIAFKKYLQTRGGINIGKQLEINGMHKKGNIFPIELSISELYVDEKLLFVGILSDISKKKKNKSI